MRCIDEGEASIVPHEKRAQPDARPNGPKRPRLSLNVGQRMKHVFKALASFVIATSCFASEPPKESTRVLDFTRVVLPSGTRIAGVRIDIFGARVTAFPKIPADWHLSLELEGSYRSRIQGECQHGVGGLNTSKDLDGIVAAATDDWRAVRIEGVIFVTKDFDTLQELKIDQKIVKFQESNQAPQPTAPSRRGSP
jgi:hypothetical protein